MKRINNVFKNYFEYSIIWDLVIVIFLFFLFVLIKPYINESIRIPNQIEINSFIVSLITVSATLIGFLLTIITVIVTFKKGFKKTLNENTTSTSSVTFNEIPQETVFDKKVNKEGVFYNTDMHKKVIDVFILASYEIGIVLLTLLVIQFNILKFTIPTITIFCGASLLLFMFSMLRSIYIFRLFLRVHL